MITLSVLQQELASNRIKYYEIFSLGTIVAAGLYLGDLNAFIKFVKEQRIPFVLCCENYINPDEYIISDDVIAQFAYKIPKDFIKEVNNDIQRYNNKLISLESNYPKSIVLACLYQGHYFYTSFENAFSIDGREIVSPKDVLNSILLNNQSKLEQIKRNQTDTIELQKSELRDYILSDPSFRNQTNQRFRRNYIIDILSSKLDDHFALLKERWYREELHSVWQEAIDFIEILWRESKEQN